MCCLRNQTPLPTRPANISNKQQVLTRSGFFLGGRHGLISCITLSSLQTKKQSIYFQLFIDVSSTIPTMYVLIRVPIICTSMYAYAKACATFFRDIALLAFYIDTVLILFISRCSPFHISIVLQFSYCLLLVLEFYKLLGTPCKFECEGGGSTRYSSNTPAWRFKVFSL